MVLEVGQGFRGVFSNFPDKHCCNQVLKVNDISDEVMLIGLFWYVMKMSYHVCDKPTKNPYPQSNSDKNKGKIPIEGHSKKYFSTPNYQVIKNKKGLRNFLRSLGRHDD